MDGKRNERGRENLMTAILIALAALAQKENLK